MRRAIVCAVFQNSCDMEEAVEVLLRQGFGAASLSIMLFPAADPGSETKTNPAAAWAGASRGHSQARWPSGVRALALPGVGPLIAAGPIADLQRGAGVNRFAAGVAQVLAGIGIAEGAAKDYERRIKGGGILLAVHCGSSAAAKKANDRLSRTRAGGVASTGILRAVA
jgi:hypothetical protein